MAKRGTLDNPKTKRLARALKTCPGVALGILETLWHWVGEFRRDGGLTRIDIEDALDSGGWLTMFEADQVIAAMSDADRECVWLDLLPDGRLFVHDWHEHTDDAVHRWLARRIETFANGVVPDVGRLGKDERERIQGEFERRAFSSERTLGASKRIPSASGAPNVRPSSKSDPSTGALPVPGTFDAAVIPDQEVQPAVEGQPASSVTVLSDGESRWARANEPARSVGIAICRANALLGARPPTERDKTRRLRAADGCRLLVEDAEFGVEGVVELFVWTVQHKTGNWSWSSIHGSRVQLRHQIRHGVEVRATRSVGLDFGLAGARRPQAAMKTELLDRRLKKGKISRDEYDHTLQEIAHTAA